MSELIYQKLSEGFGEKPDRIGLEIERIGCCVDGKVIRYETHIRPLLEALVAERDWSVSYRVGEHILGLSKGGSNISLEPGAQFELATPPVNTVFEIREVQERLDEEIRTIPFARNWTWMDIGLNPVEDPETIPLLPAPRYHIMDRYYKRVEGGGRGSEMMRLTAGFQVNVDTPNEARTIKLLRAAFYLAPVLNAIFAHSPYEYGKLTGNLSERAFIWPKVDPVRVGYMQEALEKDFDLHVYADRVAKLPMVYAFDQNGEAFDPQGASFYELSPELQKLNTLYALKQLFTEVRLNPLTMEIRCFDQQPPGLRYAAIAFTVGLIYNQKALDELEQRAFSETATSLSARQERGAKVGLKDNEIFEIAKELFRWSKEGLKSRGHGEEGFLVLMEGNIRDRVTPAEQLIERMGKEFRLPS